MDLRGYLTHVGDKKAAQILNAKRRTVKAWRLGTRFPRKEWRQRIAKATGGLVTFAETYDDSSE